VFCVVQGCYLLVNIGGIKVKKLKEGKYTINFFLTIKKLFLFIFLLEKINK